MKEFTDVALNNLEQAIQNLGNLDWGELIQCCEILGINHLHTGRCGVHSEAPKSELIQRIKIAVPRIETDCLTSFTAFVNQCVETS